MVIPIIKGLVRNGNALGVLRIPPIKVCGYFVQVLQVLYALCEEATLATSGHAGLNFIVPN
jgi:hypothetical protein